MFIELKTRKASSYDPIFIALEKIVAVEPLDYDPNQSVVTLANSYMYTVSGTAQEIVNEIITLKIKGDK